MKHSAFLLCSVLFTGTFVSTTTPLFAQIYAPTVPSSEQLVVQADEDSVESSVEPSVANDTLKVGTKEIVPFVSLEDENKPYGYSVEFWERVAGDLGLKTEWVRYDSVADMLEGLEAGQVDTAIAGISITAKRESGGFDFSYPYYRSGLQLMVRSPKASPIRSAVGRLFNWDLWRPLLLVMATSAGVGTVIWRLEHKDNEAFSSDPVNGIGQGLWFAIVTLGTFGYGDVTPNKLPGRIIACLWMGASFFIVADFIASLTVNQLEESTLSFEDLRGESVGVMDGTTAEEYVRAQPVKLIEFESFEEMISALDSAEVEAVVHDYPTLKYVENNQPKQFELVGDRLTQENYGIAFREGDEERVEAVNKEILTLQEQEYLQLLSEKWFGEEQESL